MQQSEVRSWGHGGSLCGVLDYVYVSVHSINIMRDGDKQTNGCKRVHRTRTTAILIYSNVRHLATYR